MNILNKLKETSISVIPVMAIVLVLGLTAVPMGGIMLGRFVFGGFLLIIGLTIFLLGVDLGIQPMGERCGAELTKKRNLVLLVGVAFVIGFMVTVAEPDIQVFGDQVKNVFSNVDKLVLVVIIAVGVGLFVMVGLLRTVLHFSLKLTLLVAYIVMFVIALFVPNEFVGVAFDSGGATTGPMTVPFILALGLGVSTVRSDDKSSFGLTGITSVGPVLAVLVYSLVIAGSGIGVDGASVSAVGAGVASAAGETASVASEIVGEVTSGVAQVAIGADVAQVAGEVASGAAQIGESQGFFAPFTNAMPGIVLESLLSISPLVIMLIIFQLTLLKMSARQIIRVIIGLVYSFVGLLLFLCGVNGGFMPAGKELGMALGQKAATLGGIWFVLLICTGLVLGAIVVCAEPAVWVLTEQVEHVSAGTIKRKVLLVFLAAGAAAAIGLSLWRAVEGFSLKFILIPGYIVAMLLMIFSPSLFTGIAFDSGGVASGPITSTFVLSFTLGAAKSSGGSADAFGVIALVAMMPLIAIQLLGIIYDKKKHKKEGGKHE
ncbi:MAG: DUF1538 domain-containing protein [Treponemataceae bacterium]|nr:DUF1538 domain-containing protein [Treponemataceae bacterium]